MNDPGKTHQNYMTGDADFNYIAMKWNCINPWRRDYNWTKSTGYCTGKQTDYTVFNKLGKVNLFIVFNAFIIYETRVKK